MAVMAGILTLSHTPFTLSNTGEGSTVYGVDHVPELVQRSLESVASDSDHVMTFHGALW